MAARHPATLNRGAELSDQALDRLAQIGDSCLGCAALAVRSHTGT